MGTNVLTDLLIIFGLSIPVVFTFSKLKIAPLIGFLLAGILAGPFGFGLIREIRKYRAFGRNRSCTPAFYHRDGIFTA